MKSGIYYFWDNKKNKIVYIGKSINVKMRIKDHLKPSHNKQQIDRVIKSEPERYEYGVLMYCDVDDLDGNEKLMIKKYSPKFNFTEGGDSGLKSEITKKRMSKAQMGHYVSDETKKILSQKRKNIMKHMMYGIRVRNVHKYLNLIQEKNIGIMEKMSQ